MRFTSCDVCAETSATDIQRYNLRRQDVIEGVRKTLSYGGIDLCAQCVGTITIPNGQQRTYGARTCERCHQNTDSTLRYSVKRSIRIDGVVKDQPAGGIDLCGQCLALVALRSKREA